MDLEEHFEAVHQKIQKCDTCGKIFSDIGKLNRHILKMHEGKEAIVHEGKKTYKCPLYSLDFKCQASFSNKQGMSLHISKTHLGFKLHKCQFCVSRFCNKFKLKKHIKEVHEGKKALVFQHSCSLCIASFKYKNNLQEHIEVVHENPHKCDICGKRFIHVGFLNQHILKMHQEVESIIDKEQVKYGYFRCAFCVSKYKDQDQLKKHITDVHEGKKGKSPKNVRNKPCKCSCCGETFKSTFSLSMHQRHCIDPQTVHEGKKDSFGKYSSNCILKCHMKKTRDIIARERMSKSRLKNKSAGNAE